MKIPLLCLAGLFSAAPLLAQSTNPNEPRPEHKLPQDPARAELHDPSAPAARPTTTNTVAANMMYYLWNRSTNQWTLPPTLSTYTYDSKGQVQQVIDSDSATTQLKYRTSYTYTASGSRSTFLEEAWTGTAWENVNRGTYSYESRGYQTEYVLQKWVNNAWQNKERSVGSKDTQGNLTVYIYQQWSGGAWVTMSGYQYEYTYNATGKKAVEARKQWEQGVNDFVYVGRELYTYNVAGGMTEDAYEGWNTTTRSFVPLYRNIYTIQGAQPWSEYVNQYWNNGAYVNGSRTRNVVRDLQGRLAYYEIQQWDNATSTWQADYRMTITRQANGSHQDVEERLVNNKWVNYRRDTVIFNDYYESIEGKYEIGDNDKWIVDNAVRTLIIYDAAGNEKRRVYQYWGQGDNSYGNSTLYTYGNFQTITLANKQATALTAATQLFPNPTSGKITLQLAGLPKGQASLPAQVLNSVGQVVQQLTLKPQQGSVQQELNVENLKPGIYTLRVLTSEGAVVKRLVRQ